MLTNSTEGNFEFTPFKSHTELLVIIVQSSMEMEIEIMQHFVELATL